MSENTTQDKSNIIKDVILQRDQDRKEKLKSLKVEKENSSGQIKLFQETFEENSKTIEKCIQSIENGEIDQKDLPEIFYKISKDLQLLNKYLSVSTVFLTNYIVRKCLQTIEEFENKVKLLETKLLPKKKFGFKNRKAKVTEQPINKKVDEVDSTVNKIIPLSIVSCGFTDKINENLILCSKEVLKGDIDLRNLESCTVFIYGSPSTVHISNIRHCKVMCGPVVTSVFVENCLDSDLVIACQQLRIHSTNDSRFYIHVTSKAIIEDSTNVQFAPYNLTYDGIESDFDTSGLDRSSNNWNKVDDFNWLASDAPSPNWKEMSEDERVKFWPL